jgi:hypothetical protein
MAKIIIVITEAGVEEVRVPSTSLADERQSRNLLDRISPVVSNLHELIINMSDATPTPAILANLALPSGL